MKGQPPDRKIGKQIEIPALTSGIGEQTVVVEPNGVRRVQDGRQSGQSFRSCG